MNLKLMRLLLVAIIGATSSMLAFGAEQSTHIVQRGETIYRIALRYGLSPDELMSANNIEDPHLIHSGLELNLIFASAAQAPPPDAQTNPPAQAIAPAAPAQQPQNSPVVAGTRQQYIVRRGDFLTQLGIDLDTSWIALAGLNKLEAPYVLHVGSTLLIPQRADVELYDPKYAAWKYFDIFAHQPGPRVGVGREIVILLDAQAIYAYENGVLQNAVRVSTGKKATPTVKGDHAIWLKRRSQTMSGDDYSLDNVEWVMYFYRDYAIHGTWWHTNFGQPMSHGCVNLTNTDAQWFYEFASIGTPVHVR
ncbi:MAG: L,D-transpeptidase family protein [Chloroflexota bacterium]|nr:L,D-transpeptidase family protein [Chloroflexota bacterium]